MIPKESGKVTGQRKKALHKKSRGGCTRCKNRRVKCDEQRPCRNCIRRGEECDLSVAGSAKAMAKCATCTGPGASLDWGREVYLMNFYTLETSSTIMPIAEATKIFQVWIPQLALNEPHLMRGLLAFAAFHMAYNQPADASQWVPIAIRNQTAALVQFRKSIELQTKDKTADDNDPRLWAAAAILGVTSLAFAAASAHQGKAPPIGDVIQTFLLLRGIAYVSKPLIGPDRDARLAPILHGFHIESCVKSDPPSEADHQISLMKTMIEENSIGENRADLLEALDYLKLLYSEVAFTGGTANQNPVLVWKWCCIVSTGYINLLKERNLPALILFAHFALLARVFRGTWFLQSWGAQAIAAVKNELPPDWAHWMYWPEKQLINDLAIFHGNSNSGTPFWNGEETPITGLTNNMPNTQLCLTMLPAEAMT